MRNIVIQFKRIYNYIYTIINKFKFTIYGVRYGKNLKVHGKIGLKLFSNSTIIIGDNFYSSNSNFINPIARNICGCISSDIGAEILIGNNVAISSTCIWAKKRIIIGDNVKIGGDSLILDSDYHSIYYLDRRNVEDDLSKDEDVIIENDVLIGARCIILKGVTIGARSIIGAGSIVTKSIPKDSIAAGNPCKVIKENIIKLL